ncbi:MAG: pyridoxal-phosphate dependent enzyme, partial [Gammaproteobacteria bacterium]|nr:pyridoxal-phosphate dependent enzyme [Gammaproteobacteria bacterium]
MLDHYVKEILNARVYEVADETPLEYAPSLSRRLGNKIWLKREDLQPVFSFKLRGAFNRMAQLSEAERQHGVVTASAGNHAQGVALAAGREGIPATIVMPEWVSISKQEATRSYGGTVLIHGANITESLDTAAALARDRGMIFVHPFDDP